MQCCGGGKGIHKARLNRSTYGSRTVLTAIVDNPFCRVQILTHSRRQVRFLLVDRGLVRRGAVRFRGMPWWAKGLAVGKTTKVAPTSLRRWSGEVMTRRGKRGAEQMIPTPSSPVSLRQIRRPSSVMCGFRVTLTRPWGRSSVAERRGPSSNRESKTQV